tara:strand:+ start:50 stop:466 length:417 start_codon:yes stop_codon:yes gene_type:complete
MSTNNIHIEDGNVIGLREISDEEKLAWWRENIGGPETYNHVAVDGGDSSLIEQRTWTEEEWKTFVLKHGHHPDQYKVDLSYIGKRREEYPPETDQIGVIWKIIENISASGVDIGQEGKDMLQLLQDIKTKYPKPEIPE